MERKHSLALIAAALLSGCFLLDTPKENFYRDSLEEYDVLRMPVVEPFDILTTDTSYSWTSGRHFSDLIGESTVIDSINFVDPYVVFYSSADDYRWSIIDISSGEALMNLSIHEFRETLHTKNLTTVMYKPNSIYSMWQQTGQLPWGRDILRHHGFIVLNSLNSN